MEFQNNRTNNIKSYINYAFICYCIIWELVRVFMLSIDGYGRTGMILLLIAFILNLRDSEMWEVFRIPAVLFWTLWVVIEFIRWWNAGILWFGNPDKWYFTYYNFIRCLGAMVIAIVEINRDYQRFLRIVLISFIFFVSLGTILQLNLSAGGALRGNKEANLLGNFLPLSSLAMVATGMISHYLVGTSKKYVYLLFGLSLFVIFSCATRKAFGGIIILGAIWYLSNTDAKDFKTILSVIIIGIFALVAYQYVMENTEIGERMSSGMTGTAKYEDNLFLKFMDDRAIQYILGWELFMNNMIFGVGLLNFQYYTHYAWQLHTEYMVQLAECGIVGFSIYLCFIISIFRGIFKIWHEYREIAFSCIGWMGCILFLNFTAWSFNIPNYFIMYGIVIGCCKLLKVDNQ